jgi:hypothetical protein
VTTYLFLGMGIWLLYHAWRGIVPDIWNPGGKLEVGKRMRRSMRFIFGLGGIMLTTLGLVLWRDR